MPTLGADMTEGTLVGWLVEEGTEVHRGDVVAEVETGKGVIGIGVYEDGMLEGFTVHPGETVAVGTILAEIRGETDRDIDHRVGGTGPQPPTPNKTPGQVPISGRPRGSIEEHRSTEPTKTSGSPADHRPKISPLARSKARTWGIDPSRIQGSGPGGAVTLADIQHAKKAQEKIQDHPAPPSQNGKKRRLAMRRAIAGATSLSNREIPHYYVKTPIDMDGVMAWLKAYNQNHPVSDRILPIVPLLKAVALSAQKHPEINGFFKDGHHDPRKEIHLGVAVALRGGGLVTPCIHDVDAKSLPDLMRELHGLIPRTRAGRLRESEMRDATMTVTNLGDLGVETVYGVIYPPQLALVGFGRIGERPFAKDGMLTVRSVVDATLSGDHRATDGRTGARFLETLSCLLQTPESL
ncbi:dihydrolipoamide acetyltransferase family protein [Desulfoplanes sp.]